MEQNAITLQRDIETVTSEIIILKNQAQSMAIDFAIEIGGRLTEAKELVKHGEWGDWLKNRVDFSQSQANNLMKVFENRERIKGTNQMSLLPSNSQSLANLSYTKVLKLLALPDEEIDTFVEENDVENISTRELDKLIKERDEALRQKEEAEHKAEQFALAEERASKAETDFRNSQQKVSELNSQIADLQTSLNKAKESEKKAKAKVKEMKDNPTVPQELVEKMQQEAEEKAAQNSAAELEAKTADLRRQLEEAEKASELAKQEVIEAKRRIDELNKKVQMSNPDVLEFKRLFQQTQEDMQKLVELKGKISTSDPELAKKFEVAISAFAVQYVKQEG